MPKNQELEKVVVDWTNRDDVAKALSGLAEIEQGDGSAARQEIILRKLFAEDDEQLFAELPRWSSKNSVGEGFEVRDVRVWPSRFNDEGPGGFVACDAVLLSSGELGIFTTSAARIAAALCNWKMRGVLPKRFEVVKRAVSSGGFDVLDIDPIA